MLSWEYPPVSVGGLARHVSYLSRELARRGHLVDVVTQAPAGAPTAPASGRAAAADQLEETPVGKGLLRVWRRTAYPVWAPDFLHWVHLLNYGFLEAVLALEAGRAVGDGPPDVVHAHDWLVAFAARAVKHACRVPLVATIHATEAGRHNGIHDPWQRYISEVEWWLTYEAWRVICCSDYMESELAGQFQLPTDKIRVIPNGIDPRDVDATAAGGDGPWTGGGAAAGEGGPGPAERRIPGLPDRPPSGGDDIPLAVARERFAQPGESIVLFVGRLVREKGVDTLLDALPAVLDRRPATVLVVAGTGPNEESLRRRVGEMGLGGRVHFTGYLDDRCRNLLLRWASVAVVPSYYEPFGLTALEAMAAGTPVVVSDTGGLGETVVHGRTGLKVPPANPGELAAAILSLLEDRELAGRLAAAARADVLERYSWREVAARTEAVYAEVVRAARRAGFTPAGWTTGRQEEPLAAEAPGRETSAVEAPRAEASGAEAPGAEAQGTGGEDWDWESMRRRTRALVRGTEPIGRYNPPTTG